MYTIMFTRLSSYNAESRGTALLDPLINRLTKYVLIIAIPQQVNL